MSDKQLIEVLTKLNKQQEARIEEQDKTIRELRGMIANLQETLEEFKRKLFGVSSEKTGEDPAGDPGDKVQAGEETEVFVKEHTRKRKPKSLRKDLYESLPVRKVRCDVSQGERQCPDCDAEMEHLGYKYVREELRITPARVERVQYYQETLVCPACREELDTTIIGGKTPPPLLTHSPASPSMVAMVMYEKSGIHLPFYRQEQDWLQKGVPLSRETLANWYNRCALEYLRPVYEAMHRVFLERDVIHVDETPGQVLREPGREASRKSYFWIYLTGTDGKPPIILYDYQPGRKSEYPVRFLKGLKGFVHCDGYTAYGKLEDVTLVCCLAHCRRKFYEALPSNRRKRLKLLDIYSEQSIPEPMSNIADREDLIPAEKGVLFCNWLSRSALALRRH